MRRKRIERNIVFFDNLRTMFAEDITTQEINELPVSFFEGPITVISTPADCELIAHRLRQETILGFDTETRPSFKKNQVNKVSLLQLSSKNEAYIFQLHKTGIGDGLRSVLEDKGIIKVGVAIRDDIIKMKKIRPFEARGFLELQTYVPDFGINAMSLKKLAAIILKIKISKAQRLSNWENDVLSAAQLRYAATDAWACLEIYESLNRSGLKA